MKKVILMSGKIHCGKNQFAEYLSKELQKKGLKGSFDLFAKSLKDGCKKDFCKLSHVLENIAEEIQNKVALYFDNKYMMSNPNIIYDIESSINKLRIKDENWYEDKTDITRNILQLYGTEIFRKRVDNDWWVKQVKNRCIESNDDIIIITDCRFPNEITEMMDDNYETFVIRINRNINTNELISSHESETALDLWKEWNFIVENNGTLDELKNSSIEIAKYLTEEKVEEYSGLFTRM
jgi:hypothetical protein